MKQKMKLFKGLTGAVIAFVTIFSALFVSNSTDVKTVYAAGETMTVTTSASEVIINQEVTVTVTLNCPAGLYAAMFNLNYDASMFTYVSGDAGGTSYSGTIPLNYMDSGVPTTYSWTLKFKAVKTGTSDFTIQGDTFIDKNVEGFTPAYTNASVKVWAQGSDDATLSTLQVAGFTLNPAFGKWTTDYTVYVDHNTTAVDIVAQATQAAQGGRVEISGHMTDLQFGSNYVTVKSYAPNGKVITYNINIYRMDPPTEPPTTEPPTEPPAWSEVVVDGNSYNISADFTADMIPAGFTSTLYDYKGNEALGVVNDKLGLDLLYLMDGEHNGRFYIYDKLLDKFYPYFVINSLDNSYVVLPNELAKDTPSDSKEGTFLIGEQVINGLLDNENKDFSYFYAVNQNGEYNWYCYDAIEGTIQRFHSVSVETPTVPEEMTTTEPSQESVEGSTDNNYASENESLHAANDGLIKIRNIAIAVAATLFIVLIGLVVFLIAHKSEEKHSDKTEKVDYVKLEKEAEAKEKLESQNNNEEDIASVYEAAIMKQMAATKEEELPIEEEEELDELLDEEVEDMDEEVEETDETDEEDVEASFDDVELGDTVEMKPVQEVKEPEDTEQPEIISLDDEELL